MNKILLLFCTWACLLVAIFTTNSYGLIDGDIAQETFTIQVSDLFPSLGNNTIPGNQGINNIAERITFMVPFLTTLMAVGATVMVVWGGLHMVLGGARVDQTEKGKGIIKDALIGLSFGLLAYVIITLLGSILNI